LIQTHSKQTSCRIIHKLILLQFLSKCGTKTKLMKNTKSWGFFLGWCMLQFPYWVSRIVGERDIVLLYVPLLEHHHLHQREKCSLKQSMWPLQKCYVSHIQVLVILLFFCLQAQVLWRAQVSL
jgi:hypothetical protein